MKTAILAILSLFSLGSCTQEKMEKSPMNVVFILADDLGYKDLSCTGSSFYETPNIDKIAQEGTVFTQGYATCQVCSPSRASIMSGQFTARHGITDWIGAKTGEDWSLLDRQTQLLPPKYNDHLSHDLYTLPESLKKSGYTTFFAGKWHLGAQNSYPEQHGFDINKGGWEAGSPKGGYFSPYDNPKLADGQNGENLSLRLARETVDFLKANKDTSFFAFLSFYAVHGPIQTTEQKWKKYQTKAIHQGLAEKGYIMERRLPIRQVQDNPVYAGLVERMDEAVGLVLKALEDLGLKDNTIVIFTSDNGGVASGDSYSTANLPLRGGKGYQWEGGIREPFFIKVPNLKGAVASSETPVTGADFYPTILDLLDLDLKPNEHLDGQSLVPLLKGETLAERPLYWHYPHYGNQGGDPSSIIRRGKWKLIHYWENGSNELYDLEKDISETQNLAEREPIIAEDLWAELHNWLQSVDAQIPTKDPRHLAALEQERLDKIRIELLPQKERERLNYLSPSYQPEGEKWWGSWVD